MGENVTEDRPKHYPQAVRLACRREYIHGEGTLPKIAEHHGLKVGTVHRWSIEEGWGKLRDAWIEAQKRKDESATNPVQAPLQQPQNTDYVGGRLARVRVQLDRVDELMMTETDPQKLDRLASAQARLSEQERILDGRALPGSLRPREKKEPTCGGY